LVDSGLSSLRHDLDAALAHRATLLAKVAASYAQANAAGPPPNADNQTAADALRVDRQMRAERARWGGDRPEPPSSAAAYSSAVTALARLSRWFDEPTGAVLLSGSGAGSQLVRLDVDASRTVTTDIPGFAGYATPRQGYLAYVSGGKVWAVAPDGSGTPRLLATGGWLFGAVDPTAVWVGDSATFKVTEVDGDGRVLEGPVLPPGDLNLATPEGLVVTGQHGPGIEIWNPSDGALRCSNLFSAGDGGTFAVAVHGNLLAWASGDGQLHLTDVATCADHSWGLVNVTGGFLQGVAAFSPDGRTLAVAAYYQDPQGNDTYPLELIDVASARVTNAPVPGSFATDVRGPQVFAAPISAIAWTSDSTRLFCVYSGLFGSSSLIETWRVGDPAARPLHAVGLVLAPPLYVVP
jgi:WD40 repeat protein